MCMAWLQLQFAVGRWVAEPCRGGSWSWAWILVTEEGLRTRTCGGVGCGLVWMLCPPSGSPPDGARGERRELSLPALHMSLHMGWEKEVRAPGILPGRVDVISKARGRLARTARRTGMEPNSLLPLSGQTLMFPVTLGGELRGYPRMQTPGRHGGPHSGGHQVGTPRESTGTHTLTLSKGTLACHLAQLLHILDSLCNLQRPLCPHFLPLPPHSAHLSPAV